MRAGAAGVKALAPPVDLFEAFRREKVALKTAGASADRAHADAFTRTDYRRRFLSSVRSSPASMQALDRIVAEARERDVYLMCMCPYRTPDEACHSYLLLELALELDPTTIFEPRPSAADHPASRRPRRARPRLQAYTGGVSRGWPWTRPRIPGGERMSQHRVHLQGREAEPVVERGGGPSSTEHRHATTSPRPFLLLDHFESANPTDYEAGLPVSSAPRHRDLVTIVRAGEVQHRDSL
jgi:hypothetical protein